VIEFFRTLQQYREVLVYRTKANLQADARRMYLSYIWWFLEPVLSSALYFLVFAIVLRNKAPDFIGYLLIGTTVWQWFQSSVSQSMGTIQGKAHVLENVYLPKYLFALVNIFANSVRFLCVFAVIGLYVLILGPGIFTGYLALLPLVALVQFTLIFGFAINLTIASTYFRDVETIAGLIFRAGMFLSGIFYSVDRIPEEMIGYFYLNPMAGIIQCYRMIILDGTMPSFGLLAYSFTLGFLLLGVGLYWHKKIDYNIIKHLEK
jgi:ABC-type polysaccharide/polyol phosphate export permease